MQHPILMRYEGNPILTPGEVPYPVATVHNAGVTHYHGKYTMLFRSHRANSRSILGLAKTRDFVSVERVALITEPDGTVKTYWGGADSVLYAGTRTSPTWSNSASATAARPCSKVPVAGAIDGERGFQDTIDGFQKGTPGAWCEETRSVHTSARSVGMSWASPGLQVMHLFLETRLAYPAGRSIGMGAKLPARPQEFLGRSDE